MYTLYPIKCWLSNASIQMLTIHITKCIWIPQISQISRTACTLYTLPSLSFNTPDLYLVSVHSVSHQMLTIKCWLLLDDRVNDIESVHTVRDFCDLLMPFVYPIKCVQSNVDYTYYEGHQNIANIANCTYTLCVINCIVEQSRPLSAKSRLCI